jgi:hypothetical protein
VQSIASQPDPQGLRVGVSDWWQQSRPAARRGSAPTGVRRVAPARRYRPLGPAPSPAEAWPATWRARGSAHGGHGGKADGCSRGPRHRSANDRASSRAGRLRAKPCVRRGAAAPGPRKRQPPARSRAEPTVASGLLALVACRPGSPPRSSADTRYWMPPRWNAPLPGPRARGILSVCRSTAWGRMVSTGCERAVGASRAPHMLVNLVGTNNCQHRTSPSSVS